MHYSKLYKKCLYRSLAAIALVSCAFGADRSPAEKLLVQAEKQIEAAGQQSDLQGLEPARLALDKVMVAEPKNWLVPYYRGFAASTAATILAGQGPSAAKEREAALNEADHSLQKAIELGHSGEALALHATVLSMLISVRTESAAALSAQSARELAEAKRATPHSPRVLIQSGIATFYTPKEFGGDIAAAAKTFHQAVTEAEKPAAGLPSWGRAEAHVWAGQAEQKLGHIEAAKNEYDTALVIAPNYAWVSYLLIPSLAAQSPK